MSWELASFLILGVALLAAGTWYERSDPSSKLLALVATLAALAALGRIAFAALPDVKPTTDIVVIAGYALGGAAGFAVGSTAALTSNLFFGQGPWTPWQMVAWGLAGLLGAGLGRCTRHRAGRWQLACVCALMGLVFGEIMNLSTFTLSGGHTLAQYLADAGVALPFDLTHAGANLLFALAFGPALVRALRRFRARLRIDWGPLPTQISRSGAGALLVASALAATVFGHAPLARAWSPHTAHGHVARADPLMARAAAYLRRAQNPDGGLGAAIGLSSSELFSAWSSMGLAAAGIDPHTVIRHGHSLVDFVAAGAVGLSGTGDLERTILALRCAGAPARDAHGRQLAAELARRARRGSFGGQVNLTSFAVLALRAAGRPAGDRTVRSAVSWLMRQQDRDGGFRFAVRGNASGIDDTAGTLEALAAAGRRDRQTARAADFLLTHQDRDGGFPLAPGEASNAQSTAWAIQGLLAAGLDPNRARRHGAPSPLAYLRSLVGADGSVHYSRTSRQTPVWVTAEVLAALASRTLPIRAARPRPARRVRIARAPRPAAVGPRRRRAAAGRSGRRAARGLLAARRRSMDAGTLVLARSAGALAGLMLGALVAQAPGSPANR